MKHYSRIEITDDLIGDEPLPHLKSKKRALNFLQTAGQLAVDAHADWATAASSVHSSESVLSQIRERGNKSWDEALHNLRLHGMKHDDQEEFSQLDVNEDGAFLTPDEHAQVCLGLGEDFEPLNQMHRRDLIAKILNRTAIVLLIAFSSFAIGSLYGFHMGQDTPKITAAELADQLNKLEVANAK